MTSERSRLGGMTPFLFGSSAMFATMYSTQAILPQLGRAFGVSPSRASLTISALSAALLPCVAGWRVALGAVPLLPLTATVVLRRLPAEPPTTATTASAERGAVGALLRNRSLVAATLAGSCLFFGFVGASSFIDFRLERAPFSLPPVAASLVFALLLFGA